MESMAGMEADINGHQSQELDVLRTIHHCVPNQCEPQFVATIPTDGGQCRSPISKPCLHQRRLSTSFHRQLPCNHPSMTTVKIWSADTQVLAFSVYIPPVPMQKPEKVSAGTILAAIQVTIQNTLQDSSDATGIILSGDLNRHDPAWGGTARKLDNVVEKLTRGIMTAVDRHTPDLRPCPYSKRWYFANLKSQQTAVNQARSKWQESCAEAGRDDPRSMSLLMICARNEGNGRERSKKPRPHI